MRIKYIKLTTQVSYIIMFKVAIEAKYIAINHKIEKNDTIYLN